MELLSTLFSRISLSPFRSSAAPAPAPESHAVRRYQPDSLRRGDEVPVRQGQARPHPDPHQQKVARRVQGACQGVLPVRERERERSSSFHRLNYLCLRVQEPHPLHGHHG